MNLIENFVPPARCRRALIKAACSALVLAVIMWPAALADSPPPPEVSANAAIVMDASSGTVLFEKNSRARLGMASTTKIMTAIIALERCKLDEKVKASKNAAHVEGSSMYLQEGEEQTMENMLYGLLLNSGNDAAIAIAEHCAGSVDAFVKLMTQKAHEIGAKDTNFTNPHGLYDKDHYTTAYDLALITRYALKIPKFAEIVKTQSRVVPWPGHEWGKTLINQNKMLKMYSGCDGVKPGFTPETGRTLVTSATRNGWQVIAVTLNDKDDWKDHAAMFDYAFNTYDFKKIADAGAEQGRINVTDGVFSSVQWAAGSTYGIPVPKGSAIDIKTQTQLPKSVKAPVKQGQRLGDIIVTVNGRERARVPAVAMSAVEKQPKGSLFVLIMQWLLGLIGIGNAI